MMMMMIIIIIILMIMSDDVDVVAVVDDDDDVERTRTGPYAVRSALEHQVNHRAIFFLLNHVFSLCEEAGPTGAGKTRGVWPQHYL